jgi:biofilm protein TabA
MKLKITYVVIIIFMTLIEPLNAQQWTKKSAKKWVAESEWSNGLNNIRPYKKTDMVEFATQYHKQKAIWDKVFKWMATHDVSSLAPGRYDIDGSHCFANVQDAVLRPAEQVKIESHKKYIDLQWCVKGTERFGIVKPQDATVKEAYVPDIMFWNTSKIKYVNSNPQTFFLFFPSDYHRACVYPGKGDKSIRKVCIKIEYDADK